MSNQRIQSEVFGDRLVEVLTDGTVYKLRQYERWIGLGVILKSRLEPWRHFAFPSMGKAVGFVEDLILSGKLL